MRLIVQPGDGDPGNQAEQEQGNEASVARMRGWWLVWPLIAQPDLTEVQRVAPGRG